MINSCTLLFTLSCGYQIKNYRLDRAHHQESKGQVEILNLTPFPSLERALQHTIFARSIAVDDKGVRKCSVRKLRLLLRDSQRFNDPTLSELVDLRLIATVSVRHRSLELIEHELVMISPSSGEDIGSSLYPHVERLTRRIILRLQNDCERLSHEMNGNNP